MITVDEMRKVLVEQFGIKSDVELEEALKKIGGIRIGLFVEKKENKKAEATAMA